MAGKPSFDPAQAAVQLNRGGSHWVGLGQPVELTYAFRTSDSAAGDGGSGFSQFTAQQADVARLALQSWADVANLTFTEVGPGGHSNKATILFGNYDQTGAAGAAYSYLPGNNLFAGNQASSSSDGDVWINAAYSYEANPVLWGYGELTLVHELGHSLGLEHPGDYNAGQGEITYKKSAEYREDTRQYSVMSYFSETNTGADFHKGGVEYYAASPMLDDIAAMQRLNGANMAAQTGDTTYGFNSNADRPWFEAHSDADPIIFCVWDAGGNDTFDFSGFSADQQIDLRNEHFSNVGGMIGNVSISAAVENDGQVVNLIENAFGGSGSDTIAGNDAANHLVGNAGDDTLLGGKGNDLLDGGAGADDLDGGKGKNGYVFRALSDSANSATDLIEKLSNKDTIDLSAIDADTNTAGDQKFKIVSAFDHHAGEIVLTYHSGSDKTSIELDVTGDGVADATIFVGGDAHSFHHFVL